MRWDQCIKLVSAISQVVFGVATRNIFFSADEPSLRSYVRVVLYPTMMHYFSVLCRGLLLLQRAYTKLFGPIQATLTAAMGINRVTSVLRLASSLIRDIRTRKSIREYSQQHFKQLSLDTLLLLTHHTTLTWSSRNEPGSTIYMCVYLGY